MRLALAAVFSFIAGAALATPLCLCPLCLTEQRQRYFVDRAVSMAPTLMPDDCVYVRPGTKGLSAGDVIAFTDPKGFAQLFRLIAMPGQHVVVEENVPVIDGAPATREAVAPFIMTRDEFGSFDDRGICADDHCAVPRFVETLPNGASYEVLDLGYGYLYHRYYESTVPEGSLFVLGDNRDNAADSRFDDKGMSLVGMGFVPISRVIGIVVSPEVLVEDAVP